jgi:2-alkyl-3-oxoalkanoate reductase
MKIFIAGASGAIGLPLVRRLAEAGHDVVGSTRGGPGAARIREAGGIAVPCDVFDRESMIEAVKRAEPEVVVNQLTSLPARFEPKKKGFYDANNRIRSEGGDNMIEATARGAPPPPPPPARHPEHLVPL